LTALAVKAVEAAYEVDQTDVATLLKLVQAYASAGDQAKMKEFGPKAVAAAKAAVAGEYDAIGTITVAAAYFAAGDKDQSKATAEKAIKMVDPANAGMRRYIEGRAKEFGAGPLSDQGKSER
jgi:tetratricopeptide (TPR) repeat protein